MRELRDTVARALFHLTGEEQWALLAVLALALLGVAARAAHLSRNDSVEPAGSGAQRPGPDLPAGIRRSTESNECEGGP
jgi:hypothetical protein